MQNFIQWLNERGKRTALGIYPPSYGTGQYPPLYFTPISSTAAAAFKNIHGDEHPELLKPEFRKSKDKDSDGGDENKSKKKKKKKKSKD